MWPYSWTHVGTPSHLGHMDRVAATMPSQAHAGAAQEAPNIGQWEGQDVPLVGPSSCTVKEGIPSSRRYLPTYLNALYRTLEWLNNNPPPAPLTPSTGPNSWGRPWSPYSTSHTALQRPPPCLPPPPPPRQSGTQAPIPCGRGQSSETRPPAPKTCPASIAETQYREPASARAPAPQTAAHNPGHVQPPSPPGAAPPLAASAPVSAPSPRITRYFAPAAPSAASTNSHSSSSSSNVSSL